nr:putative reverse transcriptase domain-containing protein [Tanacetum cinerariifolium]
PSSGLKLLGGAVSRDTDFISGLAMRRAANVVDLMGMFGFLWGTCSHCKELPGFKYQHDMVRDVFFDICRRAGISARKYAPVNFLTDLSDGRSTLRTADVLVFGWVGGKHACVNLTGDSPLVGLSSRFYSGSDCFESRLGQKAVELLGRVQRVMHINVMTPRSTDVVFKHIGFAFQKGLAAQLVSRLPSTTM